MHDLGLEPSEHTYDGFVKAVIYGKGVANGMEMVISLIWSKIKLQIWTIVVCHQIILCNPLLLIKTVDGNGTLQHTNRVCI